MLDELKAVVRAQVPRSVDEFRSKAKLASAKEMTNLYSDRMFQDDTPDSYYVIFPGGHYIEIAPTGCILKIATHSWSTSNGYSPAELVKILHEFAFRS